MNLVQSRFVSITVENKKVLIIHTNNVLNVVIFTTRASGKYNSRTTSRSRTNTQKNHQKKKYWPTFSVSHH